MAQESGWSVFWSSRVSRAGVVLLALQIAVSVYVLFSYPLDFGTRYWNNPAYWSDNPKEVAPEWANLFSSKPSPRHILVSFENVGESAEKAISYVYEDFPSFVSVSVSDVKYSQRPPVVLFELQRPDGSVVMFYTLSASPPTPGESPPFLRHFETPLRAYLSGDLQAGRFLSRFLEAVYGVDFSAEKVVREGVEKALFGVPEAGGFRPLSGLYVLRVSVVRDSPEDVVGRVSFVAGGKVYGLAGTDRLGRDLATGLLFGFPVALLIGVSTAVLTTAVGSSLGMLSGYMGGKVDEAIQRVCDVLNNIPLLPLLIFFTFIFKPSIWIIILILVAFGWSGLAVIVRSIVLQARTAQYVEAAESLGVSRSRILLRHITPQIAPFLISQMIFSTPSAILAEAALSFLGLGDPSLPSWGQILEYAFRSGGLNLGLWWWILPPGGLIALTGFTFVLISLGLEPVVNPRLRRVG
ncbi:MAG: ABC transporter permease [Candidatus Caldarchaeum sp.]|nr:ABC transporter permease [Candidatus Caldarchaeum sp.]MCS7138137.1 ABC transporter permease [Candidatus Caldarchaeum sp.]MDW7977170.1 ABC transporter permease [Candidatus Caldarchaeum sp.]MDW8359640.1 ABC transporter permease [Candidatus Caldarchaeum sp.]